MPRKSKALPRPRPRPGHATSNDFNPHSVDATIATVITRLDAQDEARASQHEENKEVLDAILVQAKATNGRVTKLEMKWLYVAGLVVGGWFVLGLAWALFVHFSK
jgi:hypothetical protein